MNYLITGATGLLGRSLISNLLRNKNNNIICLLHRNQDITFKSKKIIIKQGNLLNYPSLVRASKLADIIIHSAAAINVKHLRTYYSMNYQGTINLLKAASLNRVRRFVYISSWAVNPKAGDYANSKRLAETEVKKFPEYLIIRPADIYNKDQSHIIGLIKLIKKLPVIPIIGDGNYKVSPVWVEDLSLAIIRLISKKYLNNTVTVSGPKIYTFTEIVNLIMNNLSLSKPIINIPISLIYPVICLTDKLNINFIFNKEKFRRLIYPKVIINKLKFKTLNIDPLPFEEGLKILLTSIE